MRKTQTVEKGIKHSGNVVGQNRSITLKEDRDFET